MSVGSIIGGGVRLVRHRPGTVAIWYAVYLAIAFLSVMLMRPMIVSMAAFQQQVAANAAAGVTVPPAFPTEAFGTIFLVEFVAGLLGIVAFAAVVRASVHPGSDRFAFLRFGMDELRLILLTLILIAFAFAFELGAVLVLVLAGVLLTLIAGKTVAVAAAALLGMGIVLAALYLEVRISLAPVYTVLRRKIVIGPAWRATRGRFWTLFGAYLLLGVLVLVASVAILALTNAHLLTAYASFNQPAIRAAAQEQLARQAAFEPATIVPMILGAIPFVVLGAVAIGSMATAALELGGEVAGHAGQD